MTIKLTENQIQRVLDHLTPEQIIDFLSEDVEKSVDVICKFLWNYVDSKTLQEKIICSLPPIQMELFEDN